MKTAIKPNQVEVPYSIPNPSFNQSYEGNSKMMNPYDSNEFKGSTMSKYNNYQQTLRVSLRL